MALGMFEELEKAGKIKTFSQKDHNSPEYATDLLYLPFADR